MERDEVAKRSIHPTRNEQQVGRCDFVARSLSCELGRHREANHEPDEDRILRDEGDSGEGGDLGDDGDGGGGCPAGEHETDGDEESHHDDGENDQASGEPAEDQLAVDRPEVAEIHLPARGGVGRTRHADEVHVGDKRQQVAAVRRTPGGLRAGIREHRVDHGEKDEAEDDAGGGEDDAAADAQSLGKEQDRQRQPEQGADDADATKGESGRDEHEQHHDAADPEPEPCRQGERDGQGETGSERDGMTESPLRAKDPAATLQ